VGSFSGIIAFTISGCKTNQSTQAQPHHVLIAYPEHWTDGERKPCFLGPAGGYTVSRAISQPDLPQLDCDRFVKGKLIHLTPPDRIYALDVVSRRILKKRSSPDKATFMMKPRGHVSEKRTKFHVPHRPIAVSANVDGQSFGGRCL